MSSDRFNRQFILLDFRDLDNPDYLAFVRSPEFSTYLLMRRYIWRSRQTHHMGLDVHYARGLLTCSLDRERMAEQLGGVSIRTISNDLAQLERRGVIQVQHTGRQNIYVLGRWGEDDGAYYETWHVDRLHVREEENFPSEAQNEAVPARQEENFPSDEKSQISPARQAESFPSDTRKSFLSEVNVPASMNREGNREQNRDRFEDSKSPFTMIEEDRRVISDYLADFAREFKDDAPLASSITRAMNLYLPSGLTLNEFIGVLMSARVTTQRRSSTISKPSSRPGAIAAKNKMPYFFEVVRSLIGESDLRDISR
jgi:hypothetical protein